MTHIDKNSIKHFTVCFLLSLVDIQELELLTISLTSTKWYNNLNLRLWKSIFIENTESPATQ